jgi:predicted Zn finger-like uncharacterized protein
MQIACPACQKAIVLDDAKIPNQPFAVRCPGCQNRFPVTPPAQAAPPPPEPPPAPAQEAPEPPPPAAPEDSPGEAPPDRRGHEWDKLKREVTLEILKGLGLKAPTEMQESDEFAEAPMALVCEDEALFQEVMKETLSHLGYRVDVASAVDQAIQKVRQQVYEIITVDNRFPEDADGGFRILQEINALAPERRRKIFVAFVSADLNTMDTNSAFILGANLTVSKKDVRRLDRILAQGRVDHERLYRVFYQVKEELERAEL